MGKHINRFTNGYEVHLFLKQKRKRRIKKEWSRSWIRFSLSKYGVKRIKDIPCDFHYEYCLFALGLLGFGYDYDLGLKTKNNEQ